VTYAFSRYESGKTKPPVALVKLFKVLTRQFRPVRGNRSRWRQRSGEESLADRGVEAQAARASALGSRVRLTARVTRERPAKTAL
jgi:hypothetical protein